VRRANSMCYSHLVHEDYDLLTCREVTEDADDYLAGDLAWWARLQFRMHLFMCRHCRRYMKQVEAAIRLVQQPLERPAPAMEKAIMDQFQQWKGGRKR